MLSLGQMTHYITLQRKQKTADGMGGYAVAWTDVVDLWSQFLAPRFAESNVQGDPNSVMLTQGVKIHPVVVYKGDRVKYGTQIYEVIHVDDHTPGEIILTTKEVVK